MKWLGGVLLAYGAIMIALGVFAYVKDHSLGSLLGGGAIGVLAIFGAALAQNYPTAGYIVATVGVVLALAKFVPAFLTKGYQFYPAGVIAGLSLLTLVCLAVGHFQSQGTPPEVPSDEHPSSPETL